MSYGAAEIKGCDLGNLNPIYERELNKPDVHQRKGMLNVSKCRYHFNFLSEYQDQNLLFPSVTLPAKGRVVNLRSSTWV